MKLIKISTLNFSIQLLGFISFLFVSSFLYSAPVFNNVDLKQDLSQAGLPDMKVADLNGDGNMDLIISEYNIGDGTAAVEFLFGEGTGLKKVSAKTIKARPNGGDGMPFNPNGIAVADINGDNILDIAVTAGFTTNSKLNTVTTIYLGVLTGTGNPKTYDVDVNPANLIKLKTITAAYDVVIGDFNKDNLTDVVISDKVGLNLFLGTAPGKFNPTPKVFVTVKTAYDIQTILNKNGFLDIVTDHEIFFNNTPAMKQNITFESKVSYFGGNNPPSVITAVTAGDFNNDSILDVAYALNYPQDGVTPPSSSMAVMLSSGSGMNVVYTKKETAKIPNSAITDIATADLDLDGIADVVTLDNSQDAMHIYTGFGDGSFALPMTSKITPAVGAPTKIRPKLLVITSIDNNQYPDIYTANDTNSNTPSLSVLLQQKGTENFVFGPNEYTVPIPTQVATSLPVQVLRKYPVATSATINYTIVDGTAISGTDFIPPSPPTNLTFVTGKPGSSIPIEISANSNPVSSNFTIDLKNSANVVLDTATVTLQSGVAAPTLSFFATNFNLYEDPTKAMTQITVIRTPANTLSISKVDVISEDIINTPGVPTATQTADYTKLTKTLTFARGVNSQSFTIPIVDDAQPEGNEKFFVTLLNVTNGQIPILTATVTIIDNDAAIPPINNIPVANPDSYTVAKNKTLTIDLPGVLINDTDADSGTTLKSSLAAGSSLAGLTLNLDGSFTYKPAQNFTGTVTFDYVANDGKVDSLLPTTVTIDVTNTKPKANSDSYTVHMNSELVVALPGVLKNDTDDNGDSLTASLAPGSTLAGLTLLPDGSFKYQAQGVGSVSFDYVANDGVVDSLPATVMINITNTIPVANPDNYSVEQNKLLIIPAKGILSNDIDNDKDTLTAKLASGSALSGLTLATNDGSFTYQPPPDFTGEVTFQYIANDGGADSLPVTVTINVYSVTQLNFGIFSLDTKNLYSVSEDTGELVLNVVRNQGTTGQVILYYKLTDNLAKSGFDFNDKTTTPGTLIFADGVKSMPITIGIVKDTEIDPNENFLISLTTVDFGVLANLETSRVVTITDSGSTAPVTPVASGGGGGCTLQVASRFDPIFPLLLALSLLYLGRRVRISRQL